MKTIFATLRVCGKILGSGQWLDGKSDLGPNYVDIEITETEARRLANNLGLFIAKEDKCLTSIKS